MVVSTFIYILFSWKFSQVGNSRDFRDQAPACENLFLQNFFLQKFQWVEEAGGLSSSCGSSNLTKDWPILLYKHRANHGIFGKLASSLWHGSSCRQQPTHFDKQGNVLLSFQCWHFELPRSVTIFMCEIVEGVVDIMIGREIKNCKIFLVLICENLCSQNFLLYGSIVW